MSTPNLRRPGPLNPTYQDAKGAARPVPELVSDVPGEDGTRFGLKLVTFCPPNETREATGFGYCVHRVVRGQPNEELDRAWEWHPAVGGKVQTNAAVYDSAADAIAETIAASVWDAACAVVRVYPDGLLQAAVPIQFHGPYRPDGRLYK